MKTSKSKSSKDSAKSSSKRPKQSSAKIESKRVEQNAPQLSELDKTVQARIEQMRWARDRKQIISAFALGDALGSRFEQDRHEVHPALRAIGRRTISLFDSPNGQTPSPATVTDDTILTMGMAKHLLELCAKNEPCTRPYEPWADIEQNPHRGWGGTIKKALEHEGPVLSSGCGSLMRCAPIALLGDRYQSAEHRARFFWRVVNAQVSTTHLGFEHAAWSWIYVMLLKKRMTNPFDGGIIGPVDFRRELTELKNKVINDYVVGSQKMAVCDWLFEKPEGSPSDISVMAHSAFETIEQLLSTFYPSPQTLNDVASEAILRGGDCDTRAALVCPFFAHLPSDEFKDLESVREILTLETRLEHAASNPPEARA